VQRKKDIEIQDASKGEFLGDTGDWAELIL